LLLLLMMLLPPLFSFAAASARYGALPRCLMPRYDMALDDD